MYVCWRCKGEATEGRKGWQRDGPGEGEDGWREGSLWVGQSIRVGVKAMYDMQMRDAGTTSAPPVSFLSPSRYDDFEQR